MLEIALGSALMYYFAKESFDIKEKPAGAVYYTETLDSRNDSFTRMHRETVKIKPAVEDQFRGIVRQAYDYSCGSLCFNYIIKWLCGRQVNRTTNHERFIEIW